MSKINGIQLTALRNSEFAQFMTDALELVRRNDPTALQVQDAYDALKAENDQLADLLKPLQGSALTAAIEAADDRRDVAISGINQVVNGYTVHYDPTLRNHALTLQRHLAGFGGAGLARENYQSETAGVSSLVTDWTNKPELVAALTALNLTAWRDELAQANQAFNDLYLNRTEASSTANPAGVRDLRNRMTPLYYQLRDLLASYHVIQRGAEPYATVVRQINTLIEQYNTLLRNRRTSGSTTGGTTTDPGSTGTTA